MTGIAGGQHTLITTEQLTACGLSKDAVAYRVETGRFHPVFQTVYSVGCGELPPLALELAALLACGPGSFVSHHSAAFLLGLSAVRPAEVHVSVVGRYCGPRKGIRVHRIGSIDRSELRRHEGLWISSPARVLLELAATSSSGELADALGEGIAARVLNPREVEVMLRRHKGRRGVARLAAVIGDEDAVAITRSRAERAFLKLIRDSSLPMPETNVKLGPFVPDFLWRKERVIVELDSYEFHGGPDRFHRDREKDLFFRGAGFDVLRPTRRHVIYESARVLVLVAQALGNRGPGQRTSGTSAES